MRIAVGCDHAGHPPARPGRAENAPGWGAGRTGLGIAITGNEIDGVRAVVGRGAPTSLLRRGGRR